MTALDALLRPHPAAAGLPVAGALAWWDTSVASSITASAGTVSQLNDLSGNAHHLTAVGSPKTGLHTINSLNVLTFNGSTDFLWTPANIALGPSLTVFSVAKAAATPSNWGTVTGDDGGGGGAVIRIFQHRWTNAATANSIGFYGGASPTAVSASGGTLSVVTAARLLCTVIDNTGKTVAQFVSGSAAGSASFAGQTHNSYASSRIGIGAATYASALRSGYWNGDIGECIVYPSALNSTDRGTVTSYLVSKWAI